MSWLNDTILTLTKGLYPRGRAFNMPVGGYLESLHKALIIAEAQAYSDATSTLYDILPDNPNFTTDDATDWERRLGLIYSPSVPLAQRMLNIKAKLNYPGANPAMGSYLYLQQVLQAAGFNVRVYENKFLLYPSGQYGTETPQQLTGNDPRNTIQFNDCNFGQRRFGTYYPNMIVNSISAVQDSFFNFAGAWKNTFFIGGLSIGCYANIPAIQQNTLRQLILNTKPVQSVGFLLINYT